MAATSLDITIDTEEDAKGGTHSTDGGKKDVKKRKFGLFGPLKRLVRGSKKARSAKADASVVSYKAKGVSSVQTGNNEDDDDGGFNSRLLTDNRSISEGSVFKPESKEPNIEAIKKGAASVDDINKSLQPSHVTGTGTSDGSLIGVDESNQKADELFQSSVTGEKSHRTEFDEERKENIMESVNLDDIQVESSQSLQNQAARDKIHIRQQNKRKPSVKGRRKTAIGTPPMPRVREESPTKVPQKEPQNTQSKVLQKEPKQETQSKEDTKVTVAGIAVKDTAVILQITKDDSKHSHVALIDVKHQESISKTSMHVSSPPMSVPTRTRSPDSMDESTPVQLSSSPISQSMLREVKLRPRPSSMREERKIGTDEQHNSEFSKRFEKIKRFSLLKDEPTADSKPISIVESKKEQPKDETSVDKAKLQRPSEAKESNVRSNNTGSDTKFILRKEPLKSASSGQRIENSKTADVKNNDRLEIRSLEESKIEIESTKHNLHHADTRKDGSKAYAEIPGKKVESSGGKSSTTNVEIPDRKTENKMTNDIDKLREKSVKIDSLSSDKPLQKPMLLKEEYKLKREHRSKTLPGQPLSREELEKKSQEDRSRSLKDGKPRQDLSQSFKESKPRQDLSQSFKENKRQQDLSQSLKASKPQQDLSQSLKENEPRENLSQSLKENKPQRLSQNLKKENKPREELSQNLKEGKPREELPQSFKEIKPQQDLSQSLKESKPREYLSQSLKESKPREDLSHSFKESKSREESSQSFKEIKPQQNFSQSLKESRSSQSKPQELLSQSLKDRKTEKESDSPGKNMSKALSKRVEPKRLSWVGSGTSSEPVWVTRVKMKEAEEQKESVKDIKNNVNNMESKSKVTSVITDISKTPSSTSVAGREKFGRSSTENHAGLVKYTDDGIANKNKPQDTKSSTNMSQTSSVNKNKTQDTKSSTEMSRTSSMKKNVFESKTSLIDKGKETEKVPAWRANLTKTKRDQQTAGSSVKIEIIEKPEAKVMEKKEEKATSNVLREKTVGKSQDISSHRSSKVSEIAKNFQTNLQVS